jgi:hypothetical protein
MLIMYTLWIIYMINFYMEPYATFANSKQTLECAMDKYMMIHAGIQET